MLGAAVLGFEVVTDWGAIVGLAVGATVVGADVLGLVVVGTAVLGLSVVGAAVLGLTVVGAAVGFIVLGATVGKEVG